MKTKHTPGPWKRRKEWKSDDRALEIYPDEKCDFGVPSGICTVSDLYDEAVANAKLICAAPELYEACRKALSCASIDSSVRELIRASIQKATN